MFYTRRSEVDKYIDTKNEELKCLTTRLSKDLPTQEEIQGAKTKLEQLKLHHASLLKTETPEITEALKVSSHALTDLVHTKSMKERELAFKSDELADLAAIKEELNAKLKNAQAALQEQKQAKGTLKSKINAIGGTNTTLLEQIERVKAEVAKEMETEARLSAQWSETAMKAKEVTYQLRENKNTAVAVRSAMEAESAKLHHDETTQKTQTEATNSIKAEQDKLNVQKELLSEKIDRILNELILHDEFRTQLAKEQTTEASLSRAIEGVLQESSRLERELAGVHKQIKTYKEEIQTQQSLTDGYDMEISALRGKTKQVQLKNEEIRTKIEELTALDHKVVAMITCKKSLSHCEEAQSPVVLKENQCLSLTDKAEKTLAMKVQSAMEDVKTLEKFFSRDITNIAK